MRDANIIALNARNATNVASLYKQIIRLDARQQAIERVLSSRKAFFGALINPRTFWHSVDSLQKVMMAKHDEMIQKAVEAQKEEALKPKIQVVRP